MKEPSAKYIVPKKRVRKRKRRAASSSSSDDSSSEEDVSPTAKLVLLPQQSPANAVSSYSSDGSSSDSDSSSEDDDSGPAQTANVTEPSSARLQQRSPSPGLAPSVIPPFLSSRTEPETRYQEEQRLKERFRKFWMSSVADAFKEDLEEIRKEPNLTTSRLTLLVDSLASGADVYAPAVESHDSNINEIHVVLGGSSASS